MEVKNHKNSEFLCNPYCIYDPTRSMRGKCESCGMSDIEVRTITIEGGKKRTLCNQCRPPDGAYGY